MFSLIVYITHRVQLILTIYTIYQGCYTRRKLTPPPSQHSTTVGSSSVEEEAHQPLLHPSWNAYWLHLMQKQQMLWAHEFTSIFSTEDTLYPQFSQSTSSEMWHGVGGQKKGSKFFSCSVFIRKANEYHFWTDGECFRWICHEPIASVSTDTGPTWVGPTYRQMWMGKGLWRSSFLLLIYWQLTDSGRRRNVRTQLCIDWWDHKTPVGSSKPRVID